MPWDKAELSIFTGLITQKSLALMHNVISVLKPSKSPQMCTGGSPRHPEQRQEELVGLLAKHLAGRGRLVSWPFAL